MDIVGQLIFNVALLFVMMIPGIILKKCRLAPDGLGKGISNLVLYIAQPVLVFQAYMVDFKLEILINSLWVLLFSAVAHAIFAAFAVNIFRKAPDAARRMLSLATIFGNAAFMGIPLISEVLGSEATIYASVYNITFNLFLWSLGVKICTDNRDIDGDGICDGEKLRKRNGASIKKALLHPVTIAAALGLIFFFSPLNVHFTEDNPVVIFAFITKALNMIKSLVAPLSMVVLGMRLADMSFKGFFRDKYLYVFLALRHLVLPIIVAGILRLVFLVPAFGTGNEVIKVVVILAATPAASSATMFAEMYEGDAAYVSKLVAVSTIISILTMPLVYLLATLGLPVA